MLLAMINIGVYLTKGLIWAALPFYLLGWVMGAKASADVARSRRSRLWLTVGFGFYLLHVLMGFQNFYGWSHEAAYEVMALQTYDVIEVRSGAAIYVNYLFTLVWAGEVLWAWVSFSNWQQRPRWLARLAHTFMLVVLGCGMIVFAPSSVRWYSLALVLGALVWRFLPSQRPSPTA